MSYQLLHGDCLDKLKEIDDNSVDAIVTDPPYGLSFMGKKWDYDVPSVEVWRECLRVLKHGGHLLAFAGSRTYHRLVVNVEDAGFEIRDQIMWVYGSGFPKSYDISKGIDKAAGAEREVVGVKRLGDGSLARKTAGIDTLYEGGFKEQAMETKPTTPEAQQWDGWGSALKPAHEPIVVARKPLIGTIVENVLEHGTGGLNIDACRIPHSGKDGAWGEGKSEGSLYQVGVENKGRSSTPEGERHDAGRFPANFIHDGSDEVVSLFPETKSGKPGVKNGGNDGAAYGKESRPAGTPMGGFGDSGSAARFFYCAKASKAERNAGLDHHPSKKSQHNSGGIGREISVEKRLQEGEENAAIMKNIHPTVKPVDLMKYLCRLITPPNGIVLDPFMGSGTTGIAATTQGFGFIGIERDEEYIPIARDRIKHWTDEYEEVVIEQRKQKTLDKWGVNT